MEFTKLLVAVALCFWINPRKEGNPFHIVVKDFVLIILTFAFLDQAWGLK